MSTETLTINRSDFERLSNLARSTRTEVAELLEEELGRAEVVDDGKLPGDVVAMNTKVVYRDRATGKEAEVTLVYPHEADAALSRVSVLAPIGAALIGLRVGQSIRWPVPQGDNKDIEVLAVRPRD